MNEPQKIEDFLLPAQDTVEDLVLLSGMRVTFRRPSLALHIAWGQIPGRVADAAVRAYKKEISEETAVAVIPTPEEMERRAESAVVHCIVSPKFSFTPGPGEYDVRRMQLTDKVQVYRWAMECAGGSVDLETFRDSASGSVPAASSSRREVEKTPKWVPEKLGVGV